MLVKCIFKTPLTVESQYKLGCLFGESEAEEGGARNNSERDREGQESFQDHRNHKPALHLLPSSANSPIGCEELPPSTGTHLPQPAQIHLTFLGMISTSLKRDLHSCGCGVINFPNDKSDMWFG